MIPPLLLSEYERTLNGLSARARAALAALVATLDPSDPAAFTSAVLEAAPDIVWSLGDVGAQFAADIYDELRSLNVARGARYRANIAALPPAEQVEALVRWGVAPVWEHGDASAALSRLHGSATRLTLTPARNTMIGSALDDPHPTGYARKPSPGACSFCLMVAGRGAVYHSEASAGASDKFHDDCNCTVIAVHNPDDVPQENRDLAAEYGQVTRGVQGGAKAQRAAWRAHVAATRST